MVRENNLNPINYSVVAPVVIIKYEYYLNTYPKNNYNFFRKRIGLKINNKYYIKLIKILSK